MPFASIFNHIADTTKFLDLASGSHDSLNELGLNESNDDNEKLLANILEECQMEDGKALNQTSNFWNGLLEEDGNPLPVSLDLEGLDQGRALTPKFDRSVGYCSDALSLYSKPLPGDDTTGKVEIKSKSTNNPQNFKCQTEVGRSLFKLSHTKSDQLLHLKLKSAGLSTMKINPQAALDPVLQIKAEPTDEPTQNDTKTVLIDPSTPAIVSSTTDSSQETLVIKKEQMVTSCDATASHDYAAPVPCVVSTATPTMIPTMVKSATLIRTSGIIPNPGQIWQQSNTNNSQGMPTTAAITASGLRRQINGPQGKENHYLLTPNLNKIL